jgi:hypothetical protein
VTELDPDIWVGEVKRIGVKKLPLPAAPPAFLFPLSAFPIPAFQHACSSRRRQYPDPAAHAQRPGHSGPRPDPGGD